MKESAHSWHPSAQNKDSGALKSDSLLDGSLLTTTWMISFEAIYLKCLINRYHMAKPGFLKRGGAIVNCPLSDLWSPLGPAVANHICLSLLINNPVNCQSSAASLFGVRVTVLTDSVSQQESLSGLLPDGLKPGTVVPLLRDYPQIRFKTVSQKRGRPLEVSL